MSYFYTDAYLTQPRDADPRQRDRRTRAPATPLYPLFLFALSACHGQPLTGAPPAAVVALPVHPGVPTDGQPIRYPVEVAARYASALSFRVAGQIVERNVRLGDVVKKGQVVARLDAADARQQAAAGQAGLDAAEHRLTFAQRQLERDKAQFAQQLIAASALEATQDAYSAAVAGREQAADQLAVARNALGYHALVADHDGVVTGENADTGQYVAAGQAVYGFAWSGDIDVRLDPAAVDVGRISIGQSAAVSFPALPARRFTARVGEVAPAADPQSRTFRIKLTLTTADPAVRLGMTGDAILSSGDAHPAPLFNIPSTAIFHQGDAPAVWVIRSGDATLELRPVSVQRYTERAAVVSSGLADGDQVVLAGVHTVFAGEHVSAVKPLFSDDDAGPVVGGSGGPR